MTIFTHAQSYTQTFKRAIDVPEFVSRWSLTQKIAVVVAALAVVIIAGIAIAYAFFSNQTKTSYPSISKITPPPNKIPNNYSKPPVPPDPNEKDVEDSITKSQFVTHTIQQKVQNPTSTPFFGNSWQAGNQQTQVQGSSQTYSQTYSQPPAQTYSQSYSQPFTQTPSYSQSYTQPFTQTPSYSQNYPSPFSKPAVQPTYNQQTHNQPTYNQPMHTYSQPAVQQKPAEDSLYKKKLEVAKNNLQERNADLQEARQTLDVLKLTSIDPDVADNFTMEEEGVEIANKQFKLAFKTYLEDLQEYISDTFKQYNQTFNEWTDVKGKNHKVDAEKRLKSNEIYEYVSILKGLLGDSNSGDPDFIREGLSLIEKFLENTFFTSKTERCLQEQMKMDLLVFQEFFTIVDNCYHHINDPELAVRLKIKLANLPLNDSGPKATVKRSDFKNIILDEAEQRKILLEHFKRRLGLAMVGSEDVRLSKEAIKLFETQTEIPRWYHATYSSSVKPIIQSGKILFAHKKDFAGAWVSSQMESSMGDCVIVFSHRVTEIDTEVDIRYEKGKVNWRAFKIDIPLINPIGPPNVVMVGVNRSYNDYQKMEIVNALTTLGLKNPTVVYTDVLNYIQKEILLVLGNPNRTANWWGAANFEHLENVKEIKGI